MLMLSLLARISRKGVAGCLIGAAAALAFALSAESAFAAPEGQCPRGQIFWKSKKSCIDKAEAAKLGFYHGPIPAAASPAPATAPSDEPSAQKAADAPAEPPVTEPPAKAASAKKADVPKKAAVEPVAAPVSPPPSAPSSTLPAFIPPARMPTAPAPQAADAPPPGPSPYGELVIEGFAKGRGPEGAISN
jgi:hypothetical protein